MEEERRKNYAKFSGHYVCLRTHNVRAHALRSHKLNIPFLQTFSAAQYSPAGQTVLQELVLGLVQIFTPFCEDSLQTVFVS